MTKTIVLAYEPQPRQRLLHETSARLILYGGAAGGGKSHALRWDLIEWCLWVPGIECSLFRKTFPDLEANHIRPMRMEMPIEIGEWQETRKRFQFRNGSGLNFAYCERDTDVDHYQGREIHVLAVDEAAQMTPFALSYLYARNRLGGFRERVPERYQHLLPRAVLASNPGGPGHTWLKEIFIEPAPAEKVFHSKQFANPNNPSDPGPLTVYIPARMADNRYLDAAYAGQFAGLPTELARALRDGDWDAVVGRAFESLSRDRHMLRPFTPPKHWTHFMCIDWGMAVPFSIGWYCVSEGAELAAAEGLPARWLPEGAVIRYNEWYGWNGRANTGCRLPPQAVARGIIEREEARGEVMDYRIGDTEMWAMKTGPSVQDWFMGVDPRLVMQHSEKDRKRNYQEVIARLAGNPRHNRDGKVEEDPMFFVTSNCTHFWRSVPSLTLDENEPDKGPNTKLEDHCFARGTLIATKDCVKPIETIQTGDLVYTSYGWRPCVALGETRNETIWCVEFDDGFVCSVTPDHKFYRSNGELARVNQLRVGEVLCRQSFSMAKSFGSVGVIGGIRAKTRAAIDYCIERFGSLAMVKFQAAATYITRMATRIITISPIWNVSPAPITSGITPIGPSASPMLSGTWNSGCAHSPWRGINQGAGWSGIAFKGNGMANWGRGFLKNARFAINRFWRGSEERPIVRGPVIKRSSGLGIRVIIPMSAKEPVYCLHVPGPHNFCLANGVLVRNCYDEIAYSLRSQPFVTTLEERQIVEYERIRRVQRTATDPYATQ